MGASFLGMNGVPTRARARAPQAIRIGCAVSLSGPDAADAQFATWLPYKLWTKDVNDAGGIMLERHGVKVPVELLDYDDRSESDLAVRLVERLIDRDRVDLVLAPWGTAASLATAPVFNARGYPVIHGTAAAAEIVRLAPRWPWSFWASAQPAAATAPLASLVGKLARAGKLKGRVAILHAADQPGVEMARSLRDKCASEGVAVVLLRSYPVGATDLSPHIRAAMARDADAFFAFGASSDSILVTGQSQALGFNPALYYTAHGTSSPGYAAKFGARKNGVLMYGAVDRDAPGQKAYRERHRSVYNRDVGIEAIATYATLQVLQAAIEQAGDVDRRKIRDIIATSSFETIAGSHVFEGQLNPRAWAAGQWQGDEVVPVAPEGRQEARPLLFPKPPW